MDHREPFKPLTKHDIAGLLGVTPRTIEIWVKQERIPGPSCIGNRVYWHPDAFYAWLHPRLRVAKADSPSESDGESAAPVPRPTTRGFAEVSALRARNNRRVQAIEQSPA
ncbi:MAG: helix-turn-helix domain-containing protein [Comamonadaceae bacterium]|nr:helix-turn-helix domain-containing protein [Comamonadaceae bacterium]